MEINIKPISPELVNDFLHFFDDKAFTDNKDWEGCYCCFYHFGDDDEWNQQTGEKNRMTAMELIKAGKMTGYLAYDHDQPVGWCNVNHKNNFSRIIANDEMCDEEQAEICAIVCFTIAPEYRRMGIASQILNAICSDYAKKGFEYVEAYPRKGDLSSAMHYHGPLSMYRKAGFSIYKSFDNYDIVRKKLMALS